MKNEINTLLLSRINAPNLPAHIYSRPRLLNLINENSSKRLILIASPAGYGKTTLTLDYLNSSSIKYAWLNVSESIDHAYSFFYTIIHALKKIEPSFGEDSLNLLNSHLERNKFNTAVKEAITDISLTLCLECGNTFTAKTALVLDDYHHIEGIEQKDFIIDSIVKNLPESMQVIITSRQLPDLDFTYYLINDMVLKLEMEDLVFNNNETQGLLSSKYNVSNSEKINEITGKLGGWITGLHLVSQGFGDNIESVELEAQPIPENIFNFLAEKTFGKFDDETKELLLITSVIENFHSELCRRLGLTGFEEIMQRLLKDHTFIQTIPISYTDGRTIVSYNYINLFSNFLKAKLLSLKNRDFIRNIYRETYRYYEEKNDHVTAINYMIKAEDFQAAAVKINENYKEMFAEGKIEFLWTWLNSLPLSILENNTESLINFAILQKFYAGNLDASMNLLDKVIIRARDESDFKLLVRAHINRAIIQQNRGNTKEAANELRTLVSDPRLSEYHHTLYYNLAYALFHSSQYTEAEKILSGLENAGGGEIDRDVLYRANKLLGHISLIRGNYLRAVQYYEKAVNDEKNVIDRFEVLCNLTLLSAQSADYHKAEKYLSELDRVISRFPTAVLKIPYLLAKQAYLFECGDYDKALTVMKNIYEESLLLNHRQYMYLSSRLITECLYYKGSFDEAKKYYSVSLENLDRNNKLKNIEVEVFKVLLFEQPPEEKEKALIEAYDYYKANSLLYNLAQLSYYLADFYFAAKQGESAGTHLKLCFEIASANGYNSFLIREYKTSSRLLNSALENSNPFNLSNEATSYILKIKEKAE